MRLGPVTKIDTRNTEITKKVDDNVMSANCGLIISFLFYGRFGAIRKPDSGGMDYKTYIFINSNLLSYKTEKQN